MPSPFPGMDPFLEGPSFPGLHSRLITHIGAMLQKRLPEAYYAEISERLWVDTSNRAIEPDIDVLSLGSESGGGQPFRSGGTTTLTRSQPIVITIPHDERRETFIEIMTREGEDERIVTAIEIISMANKTPGETGRDLYLKKQREIIGSGRINLVEIDLLRGGKHSTAIPREWLVKKASPFDYHVCIHQFDRFEDYFVYAILMHEKLPEIAIPLLPDDGCVAIDLQEAMNLAYDDGPYAKRVRYELSRIAPPLSAEQEKWAGSILSSAHSKP